jgi:hypothetical protein
MDTWARASKTTATISMEILAAQVVTKLATLMNGQKEHSKLS